MTGYFCFLGTRRPWETMTNKGKSIISIHSLLGYQGFGNRQELEQLMNDRVNPQDFHFSLLKICRTEPAKCLRRQRSLLSTKQDDTEFNPKDSHGRRFKKKKKKLANCPLTCKCSLQVFICTPHPYINNIERPSPAYLREFPL